MNLYCIARKLEMAENSEEALEYLRQQELSVGEIKLLSGYFSIPASGKEKISSIEEKIVHHAIESRTLCIA